MRHTDAINDNCVPHVAPPPGHSSSRTPRTHVQGGGCGHAAPPLKFGAGHFHGARGAAEHSSQAAWTVMGLGLWRKWWWGVTPPASARLATMWWRNPPLGEGGGAPGLLAVCRIVRSVVYSSETGERRRGDIPTRVPVEAHFVSGVRVAYTSKRSGRSGLRSWCR